MTTKTAFSSEDWKVVLEGPPTAGMIVITAARGGMFRETVAMSKAYGEARAEHGDSELLDEIVAANPHVDHTRYRSAEELGTTGSSTSAMRRRWSTARRPPRKAMTTGASSSPWPEGGRRPQGGRAKRQSRGGRSHPADHRGPRHGQLLT